MNNISVQRKMGVILSYISIIASTLVQLIYTPFLIRMLGQSEYGLYSLVSSIIGYLTVLDLGFGNAIVVYTSKYRAINDVKNEKLMHGMFKIVFYIIGFIVAVMGIILYFNVDNLFVNTMTLIELRKMKIMMLILTLNLVVTFSFNIYSAIINAYECFVFQKALSILNTIMKPIMMIPLLFLGYKSISMCVALTIINIIVVLSNYFYCKKKLKLKIKYIGFDKKMFINIFSYSFFLFLGTIVDKINWSVDQFLLGAISGTVAVSIYSTASHFNTLFINLSTAISGVLLPKISGMVANNASSKKLTDEFIKVGRIQYLLIFLMASGFVIFGKKFIILWAGSEYVQSYYVALILIIPLCFPLIQNLGLSIMQAMNKYKFKSISTFIMAIFNVFISIVLTKLYGPIGSAIGTAVALIICNIILINIYYYKVINIDIIKFWKEIIKMTVPFCMPILLILFLNIWLSQNNIIIWLLLIVIYTIVYLVVAYLFSMNEYEKMLINKVLKKFKLRK